MTNSTNVNAIPIAYPSQPYIELPKRLQVHFVAVPKTGQPVGVNLTQNGTDHVLISGMEASSPLQNTPVAPGQLLLAVNGNSCLPSASAATKLIRDTNSPSFLVCDKPQSNSCIHVVTAPFSRQNPGALFASIRGGALVAVSKVFKTGPFADKDIQKGDIVVAVNGVPVASPEDAKKALLKPMAKSSVTVLHVLSMEMLRKAIAGSVTARSGISIEIDVYSKAPYLVFYRRGKRGKRLVSVRHDPETLHLVDQGLVTELPKGSSREIHLVPFIKHFNELLEVALDIFEDDVCETEWRYLTSAARISSDTPALPIPAERTMQRVSSSIPVVQATFVPMEG
ncbi:expressed unknown protein [Seminavis robusta]|uniref:PDZ domain-containing protein n=1 Tax=Seminavis robusta TaxID=568900 RepID=A0A9N8E5W5_9STRA|nr:expressed unknown protein [Seminavis robusta]|eukprot:Sro652_g181900.1 n/a (339) ;mRNA; r:50169-51185